VTLVPILCLFTIGTLMAKLIILSLNSPNTGWCGLLSWLRLWLVWLAVCGWWLVLVADGGVLSAVLFVLWSRWAFWDAVTVDPAAPLIIIVALIPLAFVGFLCLYHGTSAEPLSSSSHSFAT
jgi:hypothetical protein